jgi:hypothetical protein
MRGGVPVISTDITSSTIDRTVDRGTVLGTPVDAAVCLAIKTSADYRIKAELRASSFAGGHVWLRPAALDVLVTTAPGILAWSPPT